MAIQIVNLLNVVLVMQETNDKTRTMHNFTSSDSH